jgi:molybdopterin-guanine dinucleotide biosynthesis protein MobB
MKVFGIAGRSGMGKTTLLERLIPALRARGLRVSLIKHSHKDIEVDRPGKDSYRLREAGCQEVLLLGRTRWALMHELRGDAEPDLDYLLSRIQDCDLVLVEGFKGGDFPNLAGGRGQAHALARVAGHRGDGGRCARPRRRAAPLQRGRTGASGGAGLARGAGGRRLSRLEPRSKRAPIASHGRPSGWLRSWSAHCLRIHATPSLRSASLIFSGGLGGMGMGPKTPLPPLRTFCAIAAAAS